MAAPSSARRWTGRGEPTHVRVGLVRRHRARRACAASRPGSSAAGSNEAHDIHSPIPLPVLPDDERTPRGTRVGTQRGAHDGPDASLATLCRTTHHSRTRPATVVPARGHHAGRRRRTPPPARRDAALAGRDPAGVAAAGSRSVMTQPLLDARWATEQGAHHARLAAYHEREADRYRSAAARYAAEQGADGADADAPARTDASNVARLHDTECPDRSGAGHRTSPSA